ncbi:DUF4166 domain-containing protein [Piscinibacter gummiphilus]|uniref:DUF4166 domain-containing protein n=1 Tax=Piscinibacter gummiphilus TaxID=946333 RepID=A0ABZ0CWK0_9BURK|nr:DUF4166 domain-containing protein [Piscinibacter gummiphilus]WOB06869.1 DUF4166 domain-containing protein [Piscinibacter gummiphilus]
METVVEEWFGEGFRELHPLLQGLHRSGGVLSGQVHVSFGAGLAVLVGKRLASRLGVPVTSGAHHLQVSIHGQAGCLHWARRFNGLSEFVSEFKPVGHHPTGHWVEKSGSLSLELGVKVLAGGWHWEHRKTRLFGIPVPKALFPTTFASKSIESELYRFSVEVRAPALGKLLAYSGTLAPNLSIERTSPGKPGAASHVKR